MHVVATPDPVTAIDIVQVDEADGVARGTDAPRPAALDAAINSEPLGAQSILEGDFVVAGHLWEPRTIIARRPVAGKR